MYTLTAGQRSPWIDLRGISACEIQGLNSGASVVSMYVANTSPTSETATVADEGALETFSAAFFAKSLFAPMSLFVYFKNTGTGTAKVSLGQAISDPKITQLNELGFAKGTSGRSPDMPS